MREIRVQIPADLGLSDDQTKELRKSFENQLVETLRRSDVEALARPKTDVKPEVGLPEVIVEVI